MFNVQSIPNKGTVVARQWQSNVIAAGGGFEDNSLVIANNLVRILQSRSYYGKIKYLLPLLGRGINAARVPLIDTLSVGAATNNNFVDADFNQNTGLQSNGTTKYFNTNIYPGQVGTSNNGGLGYWETNMASQANGEAFGCYDTAGGTDNRFFIYLRITTPRQLFWWGNPSTNTVGSTSVAPSNSHYYAQRSSSSRRDLYQNAVQLGTAGTTTDNQSGNNDRTITLMAGTDGTFYYYNGRCAIAYMTDGTLSTGEISDFDQVLRNYLFLPTGRPTS